MANPLSTHIPKEITEYQEKIFLGLSIRQLICGALAIVCALVTGAGLHLLLGWDAQQSSYPIMVAVLLPAGMGFVRPRGLPLEQYLAMVGQYQRSKSPRIYATTQEASYYVPVPQNKHKNQPSECLCGYLSSKRSRKRIIRSCRKQAKAARKEIRKAQRQQRRVLR